MLREAVKGKEEEEGKGEEKGDGGRGERCKEEEDRRRTR